MLSLLNYLNIRGFCFRKLAAESFQVRFHKGYYQLKFVDISSLALKSSSQETDNIQKKGHNLSRDFYSAPEQLFFGKTTEKSAIFSFGVLFFLMLKGNFPFNQEHDDEESDNNELFRLNFEEIQEETSSEAVNLLKTLLDTDQESRISCEKALFSPFLMNFHEKTNNLDEFEESRINILKNPLRKVLWTLLVRFFADCEEKTKSMEEFGRFDEELKGFFVEKNWIVNVSFEEFQILNIKKMNIDEKLAREKIFKEICKDKGDLDVDCLWEFLGKEKVDRFLVVEMLKELKEKINLEEFCGIF